LRGSYRFDGFSGVAEELKESANAEVEMVG
jgi:hypothetical protein